MPSSACAVDHRDLHSFPTRRSSDLDFASFMSASFVAGLFVPAADVVVATSPQFLTAVSGWALAAARRKPFVFELGDLWPASIAATGDRKSTRLNSSHLGISYAVFCLRRRPPRSPLFPYTTLFRSRLRVVHERLVRRRALRPRGRRRRRHLAAVLDRGVGLGARSRAAQAFRVRARRSLAGVDRRDRRSEEHTSELQSLRHLVCRLLLAPSTTEISTLSLHDALPISTSRRS